MDCSWEREFVPVKGWKAREQVHDYIENGVKIKAVTFDIIDCPLFIPPNQSYKKPKEFKRKATHTAEKKSRKMVKGESLATGETKVWESMKSVKEDGFSQGRVSECVNGKRKQHKGWRFWLVRASTVEKENNNEAKGESQ